jgi:hypothetical protein
MEKSSITVSYEGSEDVLERAHYSDGITHAFIYQLWKRLAFEDYADRLAYARIERTFEGQTIGEIVLRNNALA